jgi:hypothetical protein
MTNGPALGISMSMFLMCGALAATPWRYMPEVRGDGYGALDNAQPPSVGDGSARKHVAFACAVQAARAHFFHASAAGTLARQDDEARSGPSSW